MQVDKVQTDPATTTGSCQGVEKSNPSIGDGGGGGSVSSGCAGGGGDGGNHGQNENRGNSGAGGSESSCAPGENREKSASAGGGGNIEGRIKNLFKRPDSPVVQNTDQNKKVPSGIKNIQQRKPAPIPAEADAVPSKNYCAIISSKLLRGKAGTIGGIASGQGNSECGSFFNKGDNWVLRTVYKEDIPSQSVSSLSFNPVKWICASCPKSHPIFFLGGGGGRQDCCGYCRSKLYPTVAVS
jgi:hypothetical protein